MYRILLVDDEETEREGLKFLLQDYGVELFFACNGEEALSVVAELEEKGTVPDILITDIKMPFMDGLTLAARLRKRYRELVILIYSSYGEFEYAQKAIQVQVDAYILKPVVLEEFYGVIGETLERLDKKQQVIERKRQLAERFDDGSFLQKKKLFEAALNDGQAPEGEEANREQGAVDRAVKLIEDHFNEDISLEWVAAEVYLSAGYLSGLFKKATGKGVMQYIMLCRMEKAKELLLQTNKKIVDIGRAVGYADSSYFGQQFRRHFGMSPKAMREGQGR